MKVISWNMWVKNLDPIGNLKKLIAAESPDIICLQEVKINVLEFVHDGLFEGYDYIYGFDFRKHKGGFYENYYLVTLSKKKILNQKVNKIHVNHKTQWSLWDTLMRWDESIEFLYADIELGHKKLRIFNCHMELSAGPRLRLEQFDLILKKFVEGSKNIVCGDFNIYANPKYNWMIWWMMGFSPKEIFTNERDEFEKVFRSNNLDNPLKNKQTFAQRNLQLDHIIVPKKLKTNSTVIDNLYGSDHYPILVEFKFG